MHAARLTQNFYGFFPQPVISRKDTDSDRPEASHKQAKILPAERVVEGEVLRNRRATTGDSLYRFLQRGRLTDVEAEAPTGPITNQSSQKAINAYLDAAATSDLNHGARLQSIDYYA